MSVSRFNSTLYNAEPSSTAYALGSKLHTILYATEGRFSRHSGSQFYRPSTVKIPPKKFPDLLMLPNTHGMTQKTCFRCVKKCIEQIGTTLKVRELTSPFTNPNQSECAPTYYCFTIKSLTLLFGQTMYYCLE